MRLLSPILTYQASRSPPGIGGECQILQPGYKNPQPTCPFRAKKNRNGKKNDTNPVKKKAEAVPPARLKLFF